LKNSVPPTVTGPLPFSRAIATMLWMTTEFSERVVRRLLSCVNASVPSGKWNLLPIWMKRSWTESGTRNWRGASFVAWAAAPAGPRPSLRVLSSSCSRPDLAGRLMVFCERPTPSVGVSAMKLVSSLVPAAGPVGGATDCDSLRPALARLLSEGEPEELEGVLGIDRS
jgi:hypothetical protein